MIIIAFYLFNRTLLSVESAQNSGSITLDRAHFGCVWMAQSGKRSHAGEDDDFSGGRKANNSNKSCWPRSPHIIVFGPRSRLASHTTINLKRRTKLHEHPTDVMRKSSRHVNHGGEAGYATCHGGGHHNDGWVVV